MGSPQGGDSHRNMLDRTHIKKPIILMGLIVILLLSLLVASCLSPYDVHMARGAAASSNDEAIAEFTKAIQIATQFERGYFARGFAYYRKGQYDLAINDFNKALELNPKRADSDYNGRGLSFLAKGDYRSAIVDFTKAIEISPRPKYFENRSLAYYKEGSYDLAIEDLTVAIEVYPQDYELYNKRADAYIASGQTQLAIADLRKVIELAGKDLPLIKSATEKLRNLGVTE